MSKEYARGYMPKIEYWTEMLVQAVKSEDIYEIDHCHRKLDHFIGKQHELQVELDKQYEDLAHSVFYRNNL